MRRRDHDSGIALEVADREREQRSRAWLSEQVDLEARRRQDSGTELGELRRVVPCVASDDAGATGIDPFAFDDVIGQSARTFGHRPLVQDVGPDRIHLSASTASAELEHGVERVVERLPATGLNIFEKSRAVLLEWRLGQPAADIGGCRRRDEPFGFGLSESLEDIIGRRHEFSLRKQCAMWFSGAARERLF